MSDSNNPAGGQIMIYVLWLESERGSNVYVYGCWASQCSMERLRENTFGAKLLHLFTIPFGVYEKDWQTQADILPLCHGMAGASTQRFISHLEAK